MQNIYEVIEEKLDKPDFIKTKKKYCTSKDTMKKVKGQSREWEDILETKYLIRVRYPEPMGNFYNSTIKVQITQF